MPEFGEITGDQFVYDNIDKGMPVRGNFTPNKNDKKNILDNSNLDFDLFDKKTNFNISYYDPISNNISVVDSRNIITDNIQKFSNNIDNYGIFLFNNIQKYLLKNNYFLSGYNIITILSSLYISSKNKTQNAPGSMGGTDVLLHGHALVTLFFWLQFLMIGTMYNFFRWHTTLHTTPHPCGRVVGEVALPVILMVVAGIGWKHRCLPLYLVGSLPVTIIALAWWLHAEYMRCGPLPHPGHGAIASILLYAQLTLLLVVLL
jgi:hypothetical protein